MLRSGMRWNTKSQNRLERCFLFWLFLGWVLFGIFQDLRAENPFQAGERLTYHFYWGPFMVGRGVFEVFEGMKTGRFRFVIEAKSNDFVSTLYPVFAHMESEYDSVNRTSLRFLQKRSERGRVTWEESWFFPERKLGGVQSYTTGEAQWFEIPGAGVQDKFSLIYFMRSLDWTGRDSASAILANDKGNYEVTIRKISEEQITLPDFKSIPAFKVEPTSDYLEGFVKKGKMTAWVSRDEYRIPLKVVSHLSVGTVSARLVKVEKVRGWSYDRERPD